MKHKQWAVLGLALFGLSLLGSATANHYDHVHVSFKR